ncbi:Gamma-aminobutyric acid type B receptor subunit 2 [Phytophthora ramorum]|uniref:Gamma-aminobutyric acid type B receptor subunit 2 n=1 Tax=Phytophthora ramorum TaxID=164328 RepID=UPI0030B0F0A1|nr:Gamma-aminobutyric acid type B receptor subunit 2 [Phytophthora ramorum]
MVVAIVAQELLGYEVSFFQASGSADMTQRMSSVGTGVCAPTHVNVEVWMYAIDQTAFAVYSNESSFGGSIGYDGLSGLFTSTPVIEAGQSASPTYSADFWRDYRDHDSLIHELRASVLFQGKHYPPKEVGCADGLLGCKNSCSKSEACTKREAAGGECLVVIMMDPSYDTGYLQAAMSNNDIPAYFCFLGISGAADYVEEALANDIPVVFYNYQPDDFFQRHTGRIERVSLPWATPERTAVDTATFGENGYGKATNNPVRVDFPRVLLGKYSANLLSSSDGGAASLINKLTLQEKDMDSLLSGYVNVRSAGVLSQTESFFRVACNWLRKPENYPIWKGTKPVCDSSYYTHDVSECVSSGQREVTFRWLLPDEMNASFSSECTEGKTLPKPVFIDCEYVPYSTAASQTVLVIACLFGGVMLGCIGFVVYEREQPIVKRSQYQFLVTMLLGGALMCFATVIYSGAPSRLVCAMRPTLVSWAFTLIFGSLVVKSMRVYRVFLSSSMKRVVLSTGTMMKVLASFLVVDIVILLSWELVSPSHAILKAESVAEIGGLDVDRLRCASSSSVFVGLLLFWKAIMLLGGLYLSILIRKVSSDFQESVWIFTSACVVLFSSLLLLPMGYFVTLSASAFFLFFSFIVLSATMLVICLMLVPKMIRLRDLATSGVSEVKISKTTRDKANTSSGADAQVVPLAVRSGTSGGSKNSKSRNSKNSRSGKKDIVKKDIVRVNVRMPALVRKASAKVSALNNATPVTTFSGARKKGPRPSWMRKRP